MKNFRRWVFNGIAALSLLLCVAAVALCFRSYFYWDSGPVPLSISSKHGLGYDSVNGHFCISWQADVVNMDVAVSHTPASNEDLTQHAAWKAPGLAYIRWDIPPTAPQIRFRGVTVSYWLVAVIFLFPPALRGWEYIRRKRLATSGRCSVCGYDLRATPDRCPECGTIPTK